MGRVEGRPTRALRELIGMVVEGCPFSTLPPPPASPQGRDCAYGQKCSLLWELRKGVTSLVGDIWCAGEERSLLGLSVTYAHLFRTLKTVTFLWRDGVF